MNPPLTPQRPRRAFLADLGMGFTGLALGALFQREARASGAALWTPPDGRPHATPKAKSAPSAVRNTSLPGLT